MRAWEAGIETPALLAVSFCTAALLVGCGGSGDTTRAGTSGSAPRHETGPRGEQIGGEAASSLHLSQPDCAALQRRAEAQSGRALTLHSEPTPPSSRCRLTAPGVTIGVYLDSGHAARQRYLNRMVEQNQFGAPDPGRITHPVAGVGDPSPGNQYASWVPDLGSLFAARGNRWLTVAYSVPAPPRRNRCERAQALARLGFRLSAQPPARLGDVSAPTAILLVSGSLRGGSSNSALLRTAATLSVPGIAHRPLPRDGRAPPLQPRRRRPGRAAPRRRCATCARSSRRATPSSSRPPSTPAPCRARSRTCSTGPSAAARPTGCPSPGSTPPARRRPRAAPTPKSRCARCSATPARRSSSAACQRIPVERDAIGNDGLIADPAVREKLAGALRALAAAVEAGRDDRDRISASS